MAPTNTRPPANAAEGAVRRARVDGRGRAELPLERAGVRAQRVQVRVHAAHVQVAQIVQRGRAVQPPSASNDQSDAPSAARTACIVPAMDPTKTRPCASSAGDDMTSPRVSYDHLTVPAKPPPPVAAWMAKSELSAPTYATPSSPSAAEETMGRFAKLPLAVQVQPGLDVVPLAGAVAGGDGVQRAVRAADEQRGVRADGVADRRGGHHRAPAGYFHLTAPSAKTPYTNPSAQPTYAVPSSASVGERRRRARPF